MMLYLVGFVKRTMPHCEKNRCQGHLTDKPTYQFLIIGMFKCVKQSPELCSRNTAHLFFILFFILFLCLVQELTQVFSRQDSSCLSKLIHSILALQLPGTNKILIVCEINWPLAIRGNLSTFYSYFGNFIKI